MFQFKRAGQEIREPAVSNALPNSYGKVRTLKEDLENFAKGGGTAENFQEPEKVLPPKNTKEIPAENFPEKQAAPQKISASPEEKTVLNPFQSVPTPPPLSSSPSTGLPDIKSSASQSFFAEKPPATETVLPAHRENQPAAPKSKSRWPLILTAALVIALASGGFFYWWFFLKDKTVSPPAKTEPAPPVSAEPQNEKLYRLVVDTSQGATEIKSAVQKYATEFAGSASGGNLIEVKIIDKNSGQPIGKKDFFAGFGATVPEAVMMKLSEDYSVFVKKEGDAAKLGLAFKTVTSSGLSDEMKNWEPAIAAELASLYPGQAPAPAVSAFSSGRYKNADIRYFNFSSPADTSFDYSVVSNFLVISTSKDSMRTILDYMAGK